LFAKGYCQQKCVTIRRLLAGRYIGFLTAHWGRCGDAKQMRCEIDDREIGGRLHRCARASTRRHFPRSLGDVAAVISVACHRANAGGPVFDPIGPRQSGRSSANSGFLDPLQLRRRSTLDALPTLPAARCKAVLRHRRLFLPCLPPQSNLREPKKKPQSPRLSASLQAAAEAWRFAPGSRPHTTPTIPDETTTIPKTGNQN
jgi:hypothetical protein